MKNMPVYIGTGASIILVTVSFVLLILRFGRRFAGQGKLCVPKYTRMPDGQTLVMIALIMFVSRLLLIAWSFFLQSLFSMRSEYFWSDLTKLWIHWDARHYLGIAKYGYVTEGEERLRLVFFPLYPWFMRILSWTGASEFLCGTLISILSGCGSAVLLFLLATNELSEAGAWRAFLCFLLNPLSVFLCCVYSEGLFLLLSLGSLVLRKYGHPWIGTFLGLLSALTRMPGVIISGFVIIEYFENLADGKHPSLISMLAQVLIIFSGLFLYWAVNLVVTGDPFTYLVYQKENWYQEAGTFYNSVANSIRYFFSSAQDSDHFWTWGMQLFCIFYVMILLLLARDVSFDILAYSFVYVLVVLSPTWLLSGPRYIFGMCTLPLLQSRALKSRGIAWIHHVISAGLLLLYVYGYTLAIEVL